MDGTKPERKEQGRFTAERKAEAVLRLIRGETLDAVSRDLGVTASKLAQWRDNFVLGGKLNLRSRREDAVEDVKRDMQAKIGELTMENEFLREKARALEAGRPLASRRSKR